MPSLPFYVRISHHHRAKALGPGPLFVIPEAGAPDERTCSWGWEGNSLLSSPPSAYNDPAPHSLRRSNATRQAGPHLVLSAHHSVNLHPQRGPGSPEHPHRSEEHTSELQSPMY